MKPVSSLIALAMAALTPTLAFAASPPSKKGHLAKHEAHPHGSQLAPHGRPHGRHAVRSGGHSREVLKAEAKHAAAKNHEEAKGTCAPAKGAPVKEASEPSDVDSHAQVDIEPPTAIAMAPMAKEPKELPQLPSPSLAIAAAAMKPHAKEKEAAPRGPCLHETVEIARGTEDDKFSLTRCDGSVAPLAVEHLSILTRPSAVQRPTQPVEALAKSNKGADLSPGIRRIDAKLVERLQAMVDHFSKPGAPAKVYVISGYRPMAKRSFHADGKALDFRIDGIKNEALVSFCKTLPDTGCGYYPNSSFIHLDVRDAGAGHVSWIDASGPGESARYVASWPPPAEPTATPASWIQDVMSKLERESPEPVKDEQPATAQTEAVDDQAAN